MQNNSRAPSTQVASLSALLHAAFVLTGVVNTMLGPLLPILSTRWVLDDAHAGYLFTSQFIGSTSGVLTFSFVAPRRGTRLTLIVGLLMMALGSATLMHGSWSIGMMSAFCFGIGMGLTIPTTNMLMSEMNPGRRAAALNLVNLSWGVGAVTCPFVVAALQRMNRTSILLHSLAGFLILLAAVIAWLFPRPYDYFEHANTSGITTGLWSSRFILILGAIFFLYVGTETSVGGWTASYARRIMSDQGTAWAMMPSFFWAALLIGRALASALLRIIPELSLARSGLGLATLGIIAIHSSHSMPALAVSVSVTGLGLSSVFPIAIAMLSHKFGPMASRVAGLMFALAGLGGASLPWLVGYASTWYGTLGFALIVPLCGCLAMLALHLPLADTKSKLRGEIPT